MSWKSVTVYFTLSICMLADKGYTRIPDNRHFLTSAIGLQGFQDSSKKEWVWMGSGKYMTYTNWQSVTTSRRALLRNFDSNVCATIFYNRTGRNPIQWERADCGDSNHFICQTGPSTDSCRFQRQTPRPEVIMPER
nr:unnamed protein product [Callosobruchus analis]